MKKLFQFLLNPKMQIAFKILVPLVFAIVAVTEGKAYWLAGVMVILMVAYHGLMAVIKDNNIKRE